MLSLKITGVVKCQCLKSNNWKQDTTVSVVKGFIATHGFIKWFYSNTF